jgi:hypothetical protein
MYPQAGMGAWLYERRIEDLSPIWLARPARDQVRMEPAGMDIYSSLDLILAAHERALIEDVSALVVRMASS